MSINVTLQGVPAYGLPGVYVETLFAQGSSGLPTEVYSAIILANMTSQGSAFSSFTAGQVFGPGTLVPCQTAQDASNLFGPGSPAALMYAAFQARNKTTPLFVAPVAAATGTAASMTVAITAVGASSGQTSGVIQFQVDQKSPAQAVFASSDNSTTIAANLAAAINGNIQLPVTATSSTGTVTITAKVVGARGNNLLGFAQVISGSGVSNTNSVPTRFTSGAGSDASGYTATLAALAMNGQRYYYYVPEAGGDNIDGYTNGISLELQSQIDTLAQPAIGLRQRCVQGSNDTVAHTVAVSTELNDPRMEIVQCNNLDLTAGELAASWVGSLMLFETSPLNAGGVNFDGFGANAVSQPFWNVPAPLNGTSPSQTDLQTCIISGVTPLRVGPGGTTSVVKRCTTRFFDLGGAGGNQQVLDLRITDAGKVTVCDYFFDDLQDLVSQRCAQMLIGDDPASGSPPAGANIVTPNKIEDICLEVINDYAAAGLINGPATVSGLVVVRNTNPSSSIGVIVPLFVSDPLHQVLILGLQNPAIVI